MSIEDIWNKYGFFIMLLFIIIIIIFNRDNKGTWSSYYYYPSNIKKNYSSEKKRKDSKGELECRRVMEEIFRKPFNKSRPLFLNNPVTGGNFNLEIDCYNNDLKIGCEYNGIMHYKYVPFFHKNKEAFYNNKYRDELKRRMCKENGIILIEVPYTVKICDIKDYIVKELRKNKLYI